MSPSLILQRYLHIMFQRWRANTLPLRSVETEATKTLRGIADTSSIVTKTSCAATGCSAVSESGTRHWLLLPAAHPTWHVAAQLVFVTIEDVSAIPRKVTK